jgi:hypothetical protein
MTPIAFVIVNVYLSLKMKLFVIYNYTTSLVVYHNVFIRRALIGQTRRIHNTAYFVINNNYEIGVMLKGQKWGAMQL